jgi:tRNA(Ile)-lysidine synthase
MTLLLQFQANWADKKLALQEDTILLAVSGGLDSMVMADLFLKSDIKFAVAHCNFQLRDKEADQDEQLVRGWAENNGIDLHTVRFQTKEKSAEWKKGTQETARILRYEWLEMIRAEKKYKSIATAHHANDNMETLLMNLFKGTGISGLHGIREQHGHIIRPLLFAQKEMLADYAGNNDVAYREDASNATDAYLRNAVRHHIVPVVKEWFPDAVKNVNESISRFAQAEILYKKAVEQERKQLLEQRGQDFYISVLKLKHRQPLETICYELFIPFGFVAAQVPHILQLLTAETGHYVLSGTHRIIRNRDFLIITSVATTAADLIAIEGVPCTIETGAAYFVCSIEKKPDVISADPNIAYIDLNKIEFPLILRNWHIGDYFYPLGMNMKKKKLSKFLIDQKIPLHEKEHIRVLECGKRIVWITGMRLDERFKVKNSTEQVLVIKRKPGAATGL